MLPESDRQNPLDEALRRELSSYGETPDPRVWAGVRRNLPGAPALRPRWRRPLPLLLLSLLPLLVATLIWWRPLRPKRLLTKVLPAGSGVFGAASPADKLTIGAGANPAAKANSGRPAGRVLAASASATSATSSNSASINAASGAVAALGAANAHRGERYTAVQQRGLGSSTYRLQGEAAAVVGRLRPFNRKIRPGVVADVLAGPELAGQPPRRPLSFQPGMPAFALAQSRPTKVLRAAGQQPTGDRPKVAPAGSSANTLAQANQPTTATGDLAAGKAGMITLAAAPVATFATSSAAISQASQALPVAGEAVVHLPHTGFSLSANLPLPTRLAAIADSTKPTARLNHRWALLAVAGPTLSYRTLRQPRNTGRPDVAQFERPAAGFGAQLQVRRVLSGRWALAAGLGYQQYATRLTLQVVSAPPNTTSFPTSNYPQPQVSQSVQSRDTYQLLTLPLQLSYGLGVPGRHWQMAVLGGVEPGYYLGGSSTADNTYSSSVNNANNGSLSLADFYNQRTYSNASSSPYRTWNLGLSLGLELRYRRAPTSRWQVLVQPTGRYVATPFLRADAADYSRQPFSLGLLAGLGWEL